jgi:opacity protein-like surface antigen
MTKSLPEGQIMPFTRARLCYLILLGSILWTAVSLPLAAQLLATPDWKLKVTVEGAAVRLKPELEGPIAAVVPKGTILRAYEAVGAWYRVLATTTRDGSSVIGYIATSDVEVLEETVLRPPDFWPIVYEYYRGLGLAIRLNGGLGTVSSADIDAILDGMAGRTSESLLAQGYSYVTQSVSQLHSGVAMGGELTYELLPSFSIGLGFAYTRASRQNTYTYVIVEPYENSVDVMALVQVYAYRLGAYYTIPLNRTFSLVLSGGPAYYHVNYLHKITFEGAISASSFFQNTQQNALGLNAGLALELNLNGRVSIFAEARGRMIRFSSMSGTESFDQSSYGWAQPKKEYSGNLYFVDEGAYSWSAVRDSPPSGPGAVRKAVLNFSGIDMLCGFRVKF